MPNRVSTFFVNVSFIWVTVHLLIASGMYISFPEKSSELDNFDVVSNINYTFNIATNNCPKESTKCFHWQGPTTDALGILQIKRSFNLSASKYTYLKFDLKFLRLNPIIGETINFTWKCSTWNSSYLKVLQYGT